MIVESHHHRDKEWVQPSAVYWGPMQRHLKCVDMMISETGSFFGKTRVDMSRAC